MANGLLVNARLRPGQFPVGPQGTSPARNGERPPAALVARRAGVAKPSAKERLAGRQRWLSRSLTMAGPTRSGTWHSATYWASSGPKNAATMP